VVSGLVIAMAAVSFTVIFNATGVVNYANGQFILLGGYLSWTFEVTVGLPFLAAVPLILVISAALGVLVDWFVIGPLRDSTLLVQVTALVALTSVLNGVFQKTFSSEPRNLPNYLGNKAIVPGVNWSATDIAIMVVTVMLILLIVAFLYGTRAGSYARATADNRLAAGLVGIDPRRVATAAWAAGGAVAALAGVLLLPKQLLVPGSGLSLTLLAFGAVVLGGFGSLPGAIVGGLIIGLADAAVAQTLGGGWDSLVVLVLMLVILTARPTGLLQKAAAT
jgi:branched-chain amino acid transport system permease protein